MDNVFTLHDILQELQTWVHTTDEQMMLALKSGIDNSNNTEFKDCLFEYQIGNYDEDIELLQVRLLNLIPEE